MEAFKGKYFVTTIVFGICGFCISFLFYGVSMATPNFFDESTFYHTLYNVASMKNVFVVVIFQKLYVKFGYFFKFYLKFLKK
jgi:hypothetical protein